jgi:hypothetical protein
MRRAATPRRSLTATASAIRRRSPVCWIACPSSLRSCASGVSTGKGSPHQPDRADLRGDPPAEQGHRPAARRALLPEPGVGGAGPRLTRLAWGGHDPGRRAGPAGAAPSAPPPRTTPGGGRPACHPCRLPCPIGSRVRPLSTGSGTPPPVRTPSPKPLRRSTRPRWTGTQTVCAGRGQPADDGRGRWLFDSSW